MPLGFLTQLAASAYSSAVTFLLRDEFTTPDAAPITSPRTCEPGPGTLTFVEIDGTWATSGGVLNFTEQSTAKWGDQSFVDETLRARTAGMMLYGNITFATAATGRYCWFGFNNDTSPADSNSAGVDGFRIDNGTLFNVVQNGTTIFPLGTASATNYQILVIYRSAGFFLVANGGLYTNRLMWVSGTGASGGYPAFSIYKHQGSIESIRVAQLAAPWDTDNGIATDVKAGSVSAGTTFTHEADCIIEYTQTVLHTGGSNQLFFRMQDEQNHWVLAPQTNGGAVLYEEVGGSAVARGSASAGSITDGTRVVIICDDETISVYADNAKLFSYTSAANFKTATSGKYAYIGTGGVASDIIIWPSTLSGAALTELEKYTEA